MAVRHVPFALYLDTSALLKLFVQEAGSERVRGLVSGRQGAEVILVSRLGYTEASVGLSRLMHLGRLPAADLPRHLGSLDDYWDQSIQPVELLEEVLKDATHLAQRFPLRTCDAIHLASAREGRRMVRGRFEGGVKFLAFDAALVKAAEEMGFPVPA